MKYKLIYSDVSYAQSKVHIACTDDVDADYANLFSWEVAVMVSLTLKEGELRYRLFKGRGSVNFGKWSDTWNKERTYSSKIINNKSGDLKSLFFTVHSDHILGIRDYLKTRAL